MRTETILVVPAHEQGADEQVDLVAAHEDLLDWWAAQVFDTMWAAATIVDDRLRESGVNGEDRFSLLDELVTYALGLAERELPEIIGDIVDREI